MLLEGFHEGTILENNIRELTNEEKRLLKNNDWYSLPRDFLRCTTIYIKFNK